VVKGTEIGGDTGIACARYPCLRRRDSTGVPEEARMRVGKRESIGRGCVSSSRRGDNYGC
jgi:hypothetical protein